ncbi:MAG TPA: bifunctional precorrin-2 dehydrogenase/sirohydrochlorin ferrochelatase [Chloroflexota bacterium]|nr:bifunctional precorrin-2 dehydrogenase/sirohydrochlorin ferrochelatase [Chloroflexota bacterium]
MTNQYYPVALDLRAKHCLVAGGGKIATEKVEGLLAAGAEVTVVSPDVTARLAQLAREARIAIHRREYDVVDLTGIYLAYGATDDPVVNARVTADARTAGILVNAVDDIPNCDFFAMAITRRGDLQIAVSTNGRSPAFARWVREHLDETLPPELGELLALLGEVRDDIKARGPIPPYERWEAAITDEVRFRLRRGDREGARRLIVEALHRAGDDPEPVPIVAGTRGRRPASHLESTRP